MAIGTLEEVVISSGEPDNGQRGDGPPAKVGFDADSLDMDRRGRRRSVM